MTRMNDPWDVKCVRQAGQYVSCMKINGVPLLPPVLSKECRKEMQYYKLLAKEVDKRISLLQPFVADSDSDSEDRTDAPELSECEYELPQEQDVKPGYYSRNIKKSVESSPRHSTSSPPKHAPSPPKHATSPPKHASSPPRHVPPSPKNTRAAVVCNNRTSYVTKESMETGSRSNSPKLVIDLSLSINNESGKKVVDIGRKMPHTDASHSPPQTDLPERDYNCTARITRKVITEKEVRIETQRNKKRKGAAEVPNFNLHNILTDPFAENMSQDGPASLSSKSFTGSLNDLHRESQKDLHDSLPLARQRSYTLLKPSPQLLAHLEVQSLNKGVEMSCISMSESLSSLSPTKKRRSWDLETAKVKWSTMALELKQKANNFNRNASNKSVVKQQPKPATQTKPINRPKSILSDKTKRTIKPMIKSNPTPNSDTLAKSEPVPKTKRSISPVRNNNNRILVKDPGSTNTNKILDLKPVPQSHMPAPLISESEDPAARIRELYEKIQNQQLIQMASLVEKQKREQMLLQQVFEEQNNLLFKQLKTICPTSPIEVKEAWGEKHLEPCQESDRGPVSLSQLINYKSPDQSSLDSPVSNTLTNTNNFINQCDSVLKKSRDITGSIKKQPIKARSQNGAKIVTQKTQPDGVRTRPQSPVRSSPSPPQRNAPTSRRLNYETSASSDRDDEPMLTDRTNDTMADLNVTFPSDNDDDNFYADDNNSVVTSHVYGKEVKTIQASSAVHSNSAEGAIRSMERTIQNSINSTNSLAWRAKINIQQSTPRERAAATKIVALAKGYLVRRLMRTERVQATVQTIKDALLCALQLHQDREGIRGADVDLHRRLIQQITAACYSLHDTFVASTAVERCAMIAADRGRRRSIAARQLSNSNSFRQTVLMSQSHTGAFPARTKRPTTTSLMTQSNYETFSDDKSSGGSVSRHMASPHRRPWR